MASTAAGSRRMAAARAILIIATLVPASVFFAQWGYGLTGRYDRWGETIWQNDNWFGAAFFGFGVGSSLVFLFFFGHRMLLRLFGQKATAKITGSCRVGSDKRSAWLDPSTSLPPRSCRDRATASASEKRGRRSVADPTETFEVALEQMACTTAVWAPRGLRDGLFHAWRHDGRVVDRIPRRPAGRLSDVVREAQPRRRPRRPVDLPRGDRGGAGRRRAQGPRRAGQE